jgi:hypothetical protein
LYAVPSSEYQSTLVTTPAYWEQIGSDIDGEAAGDLSGYSVSLSSDGTILAVGAPTNDGNGSNSGHVRVYQLAGSTWTQLGSDIDGEASQDQSGWSVSLSADGTILAIGALFNDGGASDAGHVRVYQWSGSAWVQMGSDIDGQSAGDLSGNSVSLSGDGTVLAIGEPTNDGDGYISGRVRVYGWTGSAWDPLGTINGEASEDYSGVVALSSNSSFSYSGGLTATLAIGAVQNDGNGSNSGHVRVYRWSSGSWVQLGSDINGEASDDYSGYSVSLSSDGTILAIGAPYNDGGNSAAGHVRVYQWSGSAWTQLGLDIDSEGYGDSSGLSVSLSSDGTILAIGAAYSWTFGQNRGLVRVYQWSGSAWTQIGSDVPGELIGGNSGSSVSLSADGTVFAAGAPGSGSFLGSVRVHDFNPQVVVITPQPKHAIIKSKEILVGEHHEIAGGITLSAGDRVLFSGNNSSLVANIYGVEIS